MVLFKNRNVCTILIIEKAVLVKMWKQRGGITILVCFSVRTSVLKYGSGTIFSQCMYFSVHVLNIYTYLIKYVDTYLQIIGNASSVHRP